MTRQDRLKRQTAHRAVEYIQSGMVVGLGTGSTTRFAIEKIAQKLKSGDLQDIVGIPSSRQTENLAHELGIRLSGFADHPVIDITIDGADEVDPALNLIKGGGGALLREKVLAQASRKNIIIVDESKLVPVLGSKWALPIEVIPFAVDAVNHFLNSIGGLAAIRTNADGSRFRTDQNNLILDTDFGEISDPAALANLLDERAGIAAHGLFLNLAHVVIIAAEDGIRILERPDTPDFQPPKHSQFDKLA